MKAPHLAIGLGALLGFFALIMLFGKTETESWPSSFHTGPSGLAALERLLEREGYKTSSDRSPLLPTNSDELIIAPVISDKGRGFLSIISGEEVTPIERAMARHAAKGGNVLQIVIPEDFNEASRSMVKLNVETPQRSFELNSFLSTAKEEKMLVEISDPKTKKKLQPTEPYPLYSLTDPVVAESGTVARIQTLGTGKAVSLDSGIIAVNRHLGDSQNADLLIDIVRRLAPPGSKVVFAEAAFGNASESGLAAALGSWFSAARNQTIILAIVVCVTLGVRFGRRRPVKHTVKGARDMIDALATQLDSTNDRIFVLKCLAHQVQTEMKRLEGLGNHTTSTDLLRVLPDHERQTIAYTLNLPDNAKISRADAVKQAQMLEKTLADARQRAKERSLTKAS